MELKRENREITKGRSEFGFTLIEVLMVVVILSVLAAIVIPKVSGSSDKARMNADIATAHQVKAALDRYQAENGKYPLGSEMSATGGAVTAANLIPDYVSKLDRTVTQQRADDVNKGFGVVSLAVDEAIPTTATNLIMIYLRSDGSDAEVRAYNKDLSLIWPEES